MPAKSSSAAASSRVTARSSAPTGAGRTGSAAAAAAKEPKVLFQKHFKSVGPRNYAAHVKENDKGNQFLVLTETKRDPATGEIKKTKVFVYSEDFGQYFRMLHETAQFIKSHPVSDDVKLKRQRYWARKEAEQATAPTRLRVAAAAPATPVRPAKVVSKPARRAARGR